MTTPADRLEEYYVKNNQGTRIAGPFLHHWEAKKHADVSGGYIEFAAEESACDFDSPEAAIEHEKRAGALGSCVVGDGVYILYPEGMGRRLYYASGKYHVARRREPIEVETGKAATGAEDRKRSSIPEAPCELEWSKASYGRNGETKWIARGGANCGGYDLHPVFGPRGGAGWWAIWGPGWEPIQPITKGLDAAKCEAQKHFEAWLARRMPALETAAEVHPDGAGPSGLAIVRRNIKAVRAGRKKGPLKRPQDIYAFVHPELVKLSQEVVIVIPLDIRGHPLNPKPFIVAMGQRAEVNVAVEDILRPVVESNAAGFVVCHNHPSAQAVPSEADRRLTETIKSKSFSGQPMVDHVVVGDGEFYSFAEGTLYTIGVNG